MAFTDAAFTPATGLLDTATFVTTPASETAARQQFQTVIDQLRDAINTLIDELESETSGSSGGEGIGTPAISGVTGTTVSAQLADLKSQIDGVSAGSVSDGTITDAKLAADVKVGSLASLTTTAKTSVQAAINELVTSIAVAVASIAAIGANGWVTEARLGAGAVTEAKIGTGAVTTTKLGTVQAITLDTGDMVTYDALNNRLLLNVAGCSAAALCPVVFDTSATPPAGTFPKGTIYIQHAV